MNSCWIFQFCDIWFHARKQLHEKFNVNDLNIKERPVSVYSINSNMEDYLALKMPRADLGEVLGVLKHPPSRFIAPLSKILQALASHVLQ